MVLPESIVVKPWKIIGPQKLTMLGSYKISDVGEYVLTDWLESVSNDLKIRNPNFGIIDLRFNGGGTDATAAFSKELPSLIQNNGPIYIY